MGERRIGPFLVYCQDGIDISVAYLVEASVNKGIQNSEDMVNELRTAIEKWVRNTKEGQEKYAYAGDDMNVADIAGFENDIIRYSQSIFFLRIVQLDIPDNWVLDTSLCPQIPDMDEDE